MRQLVIEYVFEGHKRGYNFTSPVNGFNDDTLKSVWRNAMPKGQGWGADLYVGARSLKSFKLPDGRIALSRSIVTGMRDESGRGGIRRTEVEIMQPGEYQESLRAHLASYPNTIQREVNQKPRFGEGRKLPKAKGDNQIILSYPYQGSESWQIIEALVLKAACDELDRHWQGRLVSFTTLALDYRDESQLVVIPESRAGELGVETHCLTNKLSGKGF